jgi:hypothetical protein
MRATSYVYDSSDADTHVNAVLDLLESREEETTLLDVAMVEDGDDTHREAMLTVKSAVRIGSPPEALFDGTGRPDFSPGALITEEATGRRSLHTGTEALETLRAEKEGE